MRVPIDTTVADSDSTNAVRPSRGLKIGLTEAVGRSRRLYDLAEACDYLNTSERHLRRLWQERRIAVVKIGRKIRFDECDLEEFIEQNRRPALRK